MSIIVLGLAVLLFVFGLKRTVSFAQVLNDPVTRQNLLKRVAGFIALSAWIHYLPWILILIYMREEGILAAELLFEDEAPAAAISLYLLLQIGIVIALFVAILVHYREKSGFIVYKLMFVAAIGIQVAFTFYVGYRGNGLVTGAVLLGIAGPITLYLVLVFRTPIEKQMELYPLPFIIIGIVTAVLFLFAKGTHALVANELAAFRIGGLTFVAVRYKDFSVMGRLVLLTQRAIYLQPTTGDRDSQCVLRIPAQESVVGWRVAVIHSTVLGHSPSIFNSDSIAQLLEEQHDRVRLAHPEAVRAADRACAEKSAAASVGNQ